jgi:predicted ester cyclase
VTRWTVRGTHQGEEFFGVSATGERIEMRGIQIDRFEGDRIVEERAEFDLLGALQQLGAVPEPGQSQGA